jgi:hypothetical protein
MHKDLQTITGFCETAKGHRPDPRHQPHPGLARHSKSLGALMSAKGNFQFGRDTPAVPIFAGVYDRLLG